MATFTLLLSQPLSDANNVINLMGFAQAARIAGHDITSVFCYQACTEFANQLQVLPSDEPNIRKQLKSFCQQHGIALEVCISAANRRGVISDEDASDNDLAHHSLDPDFALVGLGELAQHLQRSDRVVQF
ncbi:sulfurtransferase complex subunit TusD [Pseudobowmanella zhangzhouensis]|uniref:sulfurtransferase complex subunit TusD n=1 Tax=Pseudobowmanella zhangzhouensis TaxID=1537679 RepID=UPI0036080E7F